ncbi:MAG: hypothetical protein ACREXT_19105, partial [Gammaproteobacteria bacterium]
SFTGTLTGDPESDFARDPTGARVFAVVGSLEDFAELQIAGSAIVGGNDTHDVRNLADGDFYALSIKDTNGDDQLDPIYGDALGAFGVDFTGFDTEADSISITGGNRVTGIDFPLFDPSAISGAVSYDGTHAAEGHFVGIGLFDASTFDPMNPVPDYGFEAFWPGSPEWVFIDLVFGFPDDTYYVGAFLDANDNSTYDPGTDPVGIYGGATPTAIVIRDGSDRNGIVIALADPPVATASSSIPWRKFAKRERPAWVHALGAATRESKQAKQW